MPPGRQGDRVLLTIFGRRVQPLIRYEISDMVRVSAAMCDCGRPFRCIDAIEGRQEDVLHFASRGGRTIAIHPNVFHRVMETVSASGWQVIQLDQEEAALVVNLTGAPEEAPLREIENSIRDALAAEGVETPPISAHRVSELRRGKTGKAPLIVAATRGKATKARAGGAQ